MSKGVKRNGGVKLSFELDKDVYVSDRILTAHDLPRGLLFGRNPVFPYFAWTRHASASRYVPASAIGTHLDIGFLGDNTLARLRTVHDADEYRTFQAIRGRAYSVSSDAIPPIIVEASVTRRHCSTIEARLKPVTKAKGTVLAANFLEGLLVPERIGGRPTLRLPKENEAALMQTLAEQYGIHATIEEGQPHYDRDQQKAILLHLNAQFVPRTEGGSGTGFTLPAVSTGARYTS